MTEKWRLLQQARLRMADLETMVSQRTRELRLSNDQLQVEIAERIQAERALKESQEMVLRQERLAAVGQLSAGVAHDFNNIMTVIQGHASLLQMQGQVPDFAQDSLREIETAAVRAARLTQQLLAFSRKQVMQTRSINIGEVVSNMAGMLGRALGEAITLRLQRPALLPAVTADSGMIEQVLMNLSVNARDAMPDGGELLIAIEAVHIEPSVIEHNVEARDGSFVCLTVRDTGCGMDASILGRIFEPFFTTKDVGKGTGLGLATAYGIIKQHQGWIEVASEVGKGTCFKVYLPSSESVAAAAPSRAAAIANVRGNNETVLVVEDEPSLRRLVTNVLRRHGYNVIEAASAGDALELWEESGPSVNVLLTDMVMPNGVSGRDLARTLLQKNPALKVIYTSGYSMELVSHDSTLKEGINFLPKPYAPTLLAEVVRRCLDQDLASAGASDSARGSLPQAATA